MKNIERKKMGNTRIRIMKTGMGLMKVLKKSNYKYLHKLK